MSDPIPFKAAEASTERKERAAESTDLLENKAFTAAVLALRKRYFEHAMAAEKKKIKLAFLERIAALEDIPQQLTMFMNDEKMAQARKR